MNTFLLIFENDLFPSFKVIASPNNVIHGREGHHYIENALPKEEISEDSCDRKPGEIAGYIRPEILYR